MPTTPPNPNHPRSILVIKLRALGDTVLMTSPLAALRAALPEAKIQVLVPRPWASVLANHPAIDRIWPLNTARHGLARVWELARIVLRLRRERFDWVINLHASP